MKDKEDQSDDEIVNDETTESPETKKKAMSRREILGKFGLLPGLALGATLSMGDLSALGRAIKGLGSKKGEEGECSQYTVYDIWEDCESFNCVGSFRCNGNDVDDFECVSVFNCGVVTTEFTCYYSFDDEDCEGKYGGCSSRYTYIPS